MPSDPAGMNEKPSLPGLLWVSFTAILVLLIEASIVLDFTVPIPFLALLTSVTAAGGMGGMRAGSVAGVIASLFVVHAYLLQFGPDSLTGSILQTALGSALFLATGFLTGKLRDQRDASIQALRENERALETALERETTEKDRQSQRASERETRLDAATRLAGIGHFAFEAFTGRCIYCSARHAANLGMTPEEFRNLGSGPEPNLSHIHVDDRSTILNAIQGLNEGIPQTFEFRVQRPGGEIRYIRQVEEPVFDRDGKVVEHFGMSMDLTDLRLAEAKVRQSQRIEAIGTLTGGVAHDFNNLLAAILGNLELSLEADDEADRRDLVQAAIKATHRGASLTKNLLSFARRAHLEPTRINLNRTIQDTMAWAVRVLPANVIVENSLMAGLWDVELDVTSVENALVNLLLNARDAMPGGGMVTIETANMVITEEYLSEREEAIEPGRYVMLAISDTGHGIPADRIEKVFEPFYTDKPVGGGSGLGLSMVQGFIRQSGGAIRVYSEVGVGTTFKLYFRAVERPATRVRTEHATSPHVPGETARLLLVEDEEAVMAVLQRVLTGAGYDVVTAETGDMALEVFKSDGQVDLLLTDIVMPGKLQGPALAKAIRLLDPDLPCIFMSGYAAEAALNGNGLRSSDIRLMKPIGRDTLLKAVAKALTKVESGG